MGGKGSKKPGRFRKAKGTYFFYIFIFFFIGGYALFFSSRGWMSTQSLAKKQTELHKEVEWENRKVRIIRWEYSEEQHLMEVELDITNTKCFFVGNHAKRLYVTESVIEIMSVMSLLEEPLSFDYLALAGVGKADSIQTYLVRDWEAIYLGTNQDEHGREAAEHMERLVKKKRPDIRVVLDLPEGEGSDWNDILRKRQEL